MFDTARSGGIFVGIAALALLSAPATAQTLAAGDVVAASVNLSQPGATIPNNFIGFSVEYGDSLNYTGRSAASINQTFVQLLRNLSASGGTASWVRIGGNSSDSIWWNPDGQPRPPGITYSVTANDYAALKAVLTATSGRAILGLNFAFNDPALAADLVRGAQANIPATLLASFEVGNEPDLYATRVLYTDSASGQTVYARPSTYNFGTYLGEFDLFSDAVRSQVETSVPLSGPVFTSYWGWMQYLPTFLGSQASAINMVTYHRYPLSACSWSQPGGATYPTIPNLLANYATTDLANGVATQVSQSSAAGRSLRISEINSVSCGGTDGVSNTMAAALWGLDASFALAAVGVRGLHFHIGSNAYYTPFRFSTSTVNGVTTYPGTVLPLYYGLWAFTRASVNGSRLLPVTLQSTGNVKVWATVDRSGVVRVMAINKDLAASGNARITLSATRPAATLARLSAPAVDARSGLTFAGQTFDGTVDGRPLGTYTATTVTPSGATYTFSLPPASAALLTVPAQ